MAGSTIIVVMVGFTNTEVMQPLPPDVIEEAAKKSTQLRAILRRTEPEDVAGVVSLLIIGKARSMVDNVVNAKKDDVYTTWWCRLPLVEAHPERHNESPLLVSTHGPAHSRWERT